jgi:hypothetical protein
MPRSAIDIATDYWHAALAEPYGLGVIVSDPARAKTQLYAARKQLALPALDSFTIRTAPRDPARTLYLVRNHTPAPPTTEDAS